MKKLILFVCIINGITLYSQKDSAYIKDLNHRLTFKVDVNTDQLENDAQVYTTTGAIRDFVIKPNEDYKLRLTAAYRFLTLSYSFAPKFIGANDDNDEKGETKSFNLGVNLALPKIFQRFNYKKTSGFYLENTEDFKNFVNLTDEKYLKLSDMKIEQYSSESYYYFNGRKHSIKLDNNQQEIQRKSAGSFIIPLFINYEKFKAQSFSSDILAITESIPNKQQNTLITTGAGYAYHYIPKEKWYVSAKIIPLIGHEWINVEYTDYGHFKDEIFIGGIQNEWSLGYNSETFFAGGKASINYAENISGEGESKLKENVFQVFVGYRLSPPKFLKKAFDFTEDLIKKDKREDPPSVEIYN